MSKSRIIRRPQRALATTSMLLALCSLGMLVPACGEQQATELRTELTENRSVPGVLFNESPAADALPQRTLDFTARTELIGVDAPPDTKPSVVELSGQWRLTATEQSAGGLWVHATLHVERLNMGRDEVPVLGKERYEERVRTELQRPVLLHLDDAGRVDEIKAPTTMISSALGLIKGLASALQFVRRPAQDPTTWTATEYDATGEYAARYTSPAPHEFVRQRGEYTKLSNQGTLVEPTRLAPQSVSGTSRFKFDDSGLVISAQGEQQVVTRAREMIPAFKSTASWSFTVHATSTVNAQPEGTLELQALRSRTLYATTPDLGAAFELDIAKLGELRSLDEFLEAIDAQTSKADTATAVQLRQLQLGLAALLRLDESAEQLAWARVAAGHERSNELLLALSGTLRSESHQRIAALLLPAEPGVAETLTVAQKSQLMVSTSRGRAPTEHLTNAFTELLDDPELGTTALLGLGSMVYQSLESNPYLAERTLETVAARLFHPTVLASPERVEYVLRALGNSGHPRVAELAVPYLGSNAARMRATAVRALRRIEGADVDRTLSHLATADAEPTVRRAAERVLRERQQRREGRIR